MAEASLDEVLDARAERMGTVREIVDDLSLDDLGRNCAQNPSPGFPPVTSVPVGRCLDLVVREEWEHHAFAVRDLSILEGRQAHQ